MYDDDELWAPVSSLTRDLRKAAATMSDDEARFLVDNYYQMQRSRIRAAGQTRSMPDEPHETLTHLSIQSLKLEGQTRIALQAYVEAHPVGQWLIGITGIGPVISAGLLAHIDIEKAPTVGHIWAFAGLDPTRAWEKGKKRPHNASLKVICWKAGESFVKNSNRETCFYGHLYKQRKEFEQKNNEAGLLAEQAAKTLAARKIGKETEAYKSYIAGRLPPAHIHARARRWAVKLFLASLHTVMWFQRYGTLPPLPYPITQLGHAHVIVPANAEAVPGLADALQGSEPSRMRAPMILSEPLPARGPLIGSEPT
jgi:hypothetical protein